MWVLVFLGLVVSPRTKQEVRRNGHLLKAPATVKRLRLTFAVLSWRRGSPPITQYNIALSNR